MASLNEFLALRYRTLKRALADTRRELSSIEEEIGQIEKAAAAANISLAEQGIEERDTPEKKLSAQTMKEAAVEALKGAIGGMTTIDILEIINDRLGTQYPRSSLSPQLSRLKGDGVVYRKDGRWILSNDDVDS